jgi:hypothetical protein
MSSKHFQALADCVREIANKRERTRTAERIASVYAQSNVSFNYARVYRACGV